MVHDALADVSAKAFWIARGGYGATRIAPLIQTSAIGGRPIIGFSDATVLHAVWSNAGVPSVHGPNITTIPMWSDEAIGALFAMLFEGEGVELIGDVWVEGPVVEGPLVGGNLTVLAAMCGTPLLPRVEGSVVLLEDVGELPYRLDRCLTQLSSAGFFSGAKAVVVGQLTRCERDGRDYSAREVVTDCLRPLGIPVLGGLPIGHEPSSWAVGHGICTRVKGDRLVQGR